MWKNFFFFSKGERNGIYVLYCLVGLMFAVNFCMPIQSGDDRLVAQAVAPIRDTVFVHDTIRYYVQASSGRSGSLVAAVEKKSMPKPHQEMKRTFNYDTVRVELNSADTTELKRLKGIGSVLSARIVKYRDKIGGFQSVDQLRRIYGLSEETYLQIEPHIWIKEVPLQKN